jgi:hypothetical protein
VSETRIVRRIALFSYSYCYRRAKQAVKVVERKDCKQTKYAKPKTVGEIYETGFLREEHIDSAEIANKEMLKKLAPYSSYRTKRSLPSEMFERIKQNAFAFILENPELGLKLLKQFHVDMAASVEQIISMMHNKKHDLSEIAVRNLEGCYVYAKLQKLHFDRFEHHFGESFFRFMMSKDASSYRVNLGQGLGFFRATREQVEQMLSNLEGYDNQTVVFIYLNDLLAAYEHHHGALDEGLREEVRRFVLRVVTEMIYKGSGSIFKQLMMMLSRVKERSSLEFLAKYFRSLIESGEKVSRACQLLFTLCEDDYALYRGTAQRVLTSRLEINNNYINTLLNTVITLPEKYMLTRAQIERFGVIDLAQETQAHRLQQLYYMEIYLPSTRELNEFLVGTIEEYLRTIRELGGSEEAVKEKNELIKATYSITTNLISTYCQFYETPESVGVILQLLELLFQLLALKMDLPIDYKQLEDTIKTLLANKHDHVPNFEGALDSILRHIAKLPVKKQADMVKIIANRPGNFHFVSRDYYEAFLLKVLALEEQSMIYKDLLISLSTLLSYVPLPLPSIERIAQSVPKGQSLLLMQAYVMSTEDIGSPFVGRILSGCTRERRNLFCKEMLHLRGKKEYLDDEQRYSQWREIKQYSNPYHYHA